MPLTPRHVASQKASRPRPFGLTAPIPVTTTLPFTASLPRIRASRIVPMAFSRGGRVGDRLDAEISQVKLLLPLNAQSPLAPAPGQWKIHGAGYAVKRQVRLEKQAARRLARRDRAALDLDARVARYIE